MSLRDIEIKDSYRSDSCPDLGTYFVSKMLEHTVTYKRAVGFFSSSALLKLSRGISFLAEKPNSHISFVVSPILYKEDVEAIKKGYKNRKQVVEEALLRELKDTTDEFECERLNFLCHLIEQGILDIKVADKYDQYTEKEIGMFHEKIGVFIDENGNTVAFSGSLNESDNAFSNNFESIQVFKGWEEPKRVAIIEDDFDRLWEDKTNSLYVYDFPEAVMKNLFKYHKPTYHKNIDKYEKEEKEKRKILASYPKYNCKFSLYDYQKDAINKWANQNFVGLFDMGTGTGKTITALTASVKLLERLNYKMATIIVCPYTHLVEQWVEEEKNFNIDFIVGYSDRKHKNYLSKLNHTIQDFNDGIINHFYFITTNASFKKSEVQELLRKIKGNVLFIADEVHNFGAEGMRKALIEKFRFRIGLSATIDRHRDEEGTEAIYDYFGNPVIHYGLKEAIDNNVLTRYFYYPIPVYLNSYEQEKYLELTDKIRKNSYLKGDKVVLTKQGELYALLRARVIASAQGKIIKLKDLMHNHKNDYNLLVYCGTGKLSGDYGEEEKQIDEVCKILGNQLNMKVARYTSRETTEERQLIAERYKNGNDLQALVAIKCLDEGVNIPSIKTAFILASSTNPREYIQRRGRVLRKFPGKQYSYIYDFVTLPIPLDEVEEYNEAFIDSFTALARNEVERLKEFSKLAENEHESDILINNIIEKFGLNKVRECEKFEKIEWEEFTNGTDE
ncbi:MAG: DEAD/DEAH box helicase family protein [Bacilli bacterium]